MWGAATLNVGAQTLVKLHSLKDIQSGECFYNHYTCNSMQKQYYLTYSN